MAFGKLEKTLAAAAFTVMAMAPNDAVSQTINGMTDEHTQNIMSIFEGKAPDRTKFLGGQRPDARKGEKELCSYEESGSHDRSMYGIPVLKDVAYKIRESGDINGYHEMGIVWPILFNFIDVVGIDKFLNEVKNATPSLFIRNSHNGYELDVKYVGTDTVSVKVIKPQIEWSGIFTRDKFIKVCGYIDRLAAERSR